MIPALIENSVLVRGNVKSPGFYPINTNDKDSIKNLLIYLNIPYSNIILSPDKKIIDVYNRSAKLEGAVRFPLEVSIKEYSKLGIDYISTSKITNSVKSVDIGLDII